MRGCSAVTILEKREVQFAAKPRLSVVVSQLADVAVIRCSGRLCFQGEARFLADTAQGLMIAGNDLILDLGSLELLDSAGIGQLVLIHMQAQAIGRSVKIADAPDSVCQLLELTNVASLFEFFDSVDLALSSNSERVA
jgi:anti-anti-sigma factor